MLKLTHQGGSVSAVRIVPLLGVAAMLLGCSAASEGDPAPSGVGEPPVGASTEALRSADGYVSVPGGRTHWSCVHRVPEGASVDADLNVFVNGKKVDHINKCRYPAFKRKLGGTPTACPSNGTQASCWVESDNFVGTANAYGFSWFNALGADWTVPQVPVTFSDQLIFFFPGLEPTSGTSILQPVLQFGSSSAGGGNYWAMANWWVAGSDFMFSPLVVVAPGQQIHGEIDALWDSCTTDGVCSWAVSYALNGDWHTLTTASPDVYNWAFKGALEAYDNTRLSYPSNCSDYPADGTTNFTGFFASQPGPTPNAWNTANYPGFGSMAFGLPDCQFGVNDFAGSNGYDGAAYFGY